MGKPLHVGSKVMIPPLMPCGHCHWCLHYPQTANKCLTPVYYGRYLGFDKAPHLWGGWAEYVYVDLDMLPGTKIYKLPDDMSLRLGALSEPLTSCIRALPCEAPASPDGGVIADWVGAVDDPAGLAARLAGTCGVVEHGLFIGMASVAFAAGLEVVEDRGLLAEVAGLVEWPVPLMGRIGEEFLHLPPEVLQTSMKEHQK